jgi:hypothetical protein
VAADQEKGLTARLDDYELIAQELSGLAEKVGHIENRIGDVLTRVTDVEKANARLEERLSRSS